jgi:SM-20-related protein
MDVQYLTALEREGVLVLPHFRDTATCKALLAFMDTCEQEGTMRDAAIGRGTDAQINKEQRGDRIAWLEGSESPEMMAFKLDMEALARDFNAAFYLGIDHLEFHLTRYPPGTFYRRHSDRHHRGSPRIISFILYLNEGWVPAHGGQLVIYRENVAPLPIEPRIGTLALFLSELEHEVLTTTKTRSSVTGWMRQRTH